MGACVKELYRDMIKTAHPGPATLIESLDEHGMATTGIMEELTKSVVELVEGICRVLRPGGTVLQG